MVYGLWFMVYLLFQPVYQHVIKVDCCRKKTKLKSLFVKIRHVEWEKTVKVLLRPAFWWAVNSN